MKLFLLSFLALFDQTEAKCSLFEVDRNALTPFDQLTYYLDECFSGDFRRIFPADNVIRDIFPVIDLVVPHGYYKSWTNSGALGVIFKVSDFTLEAYEYVITRASAFMASMYNAGGLSTWAITDAFYQNAVRLVHWSNIYMDFLEGEIDFGITEFGNQDFQNLIGGTFYGEVYNVVRFYEWEQLLSDYFKFIPNNDYPFKALVVELSIYHNFALIFDNGLTTEDITSFGYYILNLWTSFTPEMMFADFDEQDRLWNQLRAFITLSETSNVLELFYVGHEIVSQIHHIIRHGIRATVQLIYQIQFGENLVLLEKPIMNYFLGPIGDVFAFFSDTYETIADNVNNFFVEVVGYTPVDFLATILVALENLERLFLGITTWTWTFSMPVRVFTEVIYLLDSGSSTTAAPVTVAPADPVV